MTTFPADAQPEPGEPAPPVFPLWPFAYTAYVDHCSRDYAGYVARLSPANTPRSAQETLGLDVIRNMNQAFWALVWRPLGEAMGGERSVV